MPVIARRIAQAARRDEPFRSQRRASTTATGAGTCRIQSAMSEPSFELVILIGDELRISELRNRGQVSLGRDAINEIQIDHPSVSRRHAVIRLGPPDRDRGPWQRQGDFRARQDEHRRFRGG